MLNKELNKKAYDLNNLLSKAVATKFNEKIKESDNKTKNNQENEDKTVINKTSNQDSKKIINTSDQLIWNANRIASPDIKEKRHAESLSIRKSTSTPHSNEKSQLNQAYYFLFYLRDN